jgi:hypothetical protein
MQQMLGSPGRVLDPSLRSYFEPRFGTDFSGVRVHTDDRAKHSAAFIGARAYAHGNHIFYGTDERPGGAAKDGRFHREGLLGDVRQLVRSEPVGVLRFSATNRAVTIEGLVAWARQNYPRGLADPALLKNIYSSNEFTGSDDARERAAIVLTLRLHEEKHQPGGVR